MLLGVHSGYVTDSDDETMRIAELSARTGVPIARIKFYIREGLVPRGERTAEHQALYRAEHVRRLRLVRALVTVGGIGVADTRRLLADLDEDRPDLGETLARVMHALPSAKRRTADEHRERAVAELDALVERRGWTLHEGNPARETVIDALATLDELGLPNPELALDAYAQAAELVAETELRIIGGSDDPRGIVENAVVGTVVGESLLAGMRRLAHAQLAPGRLAAEGHVEPGDAALSGDSAAAPTPGPARAHAIEDEDEDKGEDD